MDYNSVGAICQSCKNKLTAFESLSKDWTQNLFRRKIKLITFVFVLFCIISNLFLSLNSKQVVNFMFFYGPIPQAFDISNMHKTKFVSALWMIR